MIQGELARAAQGFANHLLYTAGKSPETVRVYVSSLRMFWQWCEDREECAAEADRQLINAWRMARTTKASSTTIHGNIAGLRAYYQYLIEEGRRQDNPAATVRVKRTETVSTDPLEPEELKSLFAACTNERDRLIVLLLVYSGVRIAEFAAMRAEHINWDAGVIRIPHGKGDKARAIRPAPEVMFRLHAYVGLLPEGAIWRSQQRRRALADHQLRKIIYAIAKRAGMEHVHPHRFRSTFACEMIEQTDGDLHAVKGAMGHSSIDTTARYLRKVEERRGLAKMRGLTLAV